MWWMGFTTTGLLSRETPELAKTNYQKKLKKKLKKKAQTEFLLISWSLTTEEFSVQTAIHIFRSSTGLWWPSNHFEYIKLAQSIFKIETNPPSWVTVFFHCLKYMWFKLTVKKKKTKHIKRKTQAFFTSFGHLPSESHWGHYCVLNSCLQINHLWAPSLGCPGEFSISGGWITTALKQDKS